MGSLVSDVLDRGDAARGEAIFRRVEQACLKCHAIAGAGGRVGPDLVSIGASAGRLFDRIDPAAKRQDQGELSLTHHRGRWPDHQRHQGAQTDKELVLRDVEDHEVAIPRDAIEEKKEGGSLMPVGLSDGLTRGELVDLVRFLSELGKVGPYAVSQARVRAAGRLCRRRPKPSPARRQ